MIINLEKLEKPIRDIESTLSEYSQEEQELILKHINRRIQNRIAKRMSEERSRGLIDKILKDKLGGGFK